MRSTILYIIPGVLMLVAASCTKEDLIPYEQDPRIYFSKVIRNSGKYGDSINYTFGVKPLDLQVDTVILQLNIMGLATDADRTINLMVEDSSTAVKGYHYNFGPLVMPAGKYTTEIPVLIYKRPGMKDSTLLLYLAIGESKDFKPGYTDKTTTSSVRDRLHYKISMTDQLIKPSNWDNSLVSSFGAYSKVKYQFMITSTGKTEWDVTIFPSEQNYLVQACKEALYNYEQQHGPLIDEAGNRVTFP